MLGCCSLAFEDKNKYNFVKEKRQFAKWIWVKRSRKEIILKLEEWWFFFQKVMTVWNRDSFFSKMVADETILLYFINFPRNGDATKILLSNFLLNCFFELFYSSSSLYCMCFYTSIVTFLSIFSIQLSIIQTVRKEKA